MITIELVLCEHVDLFTVHLSRMIACSDVTQLIQIAFTRLFAFSVSTAHRTLLINAQPRIDRNALHCEQIFGLIKILVYQ